MKLKYSFGIIISCLLQVTVNCIKLFLFSYYPLYPPADDVSVDYELFESGAKMSVTPHVLIIPSDLKQFVKVCVHYNVYLHLRYLKIHVFHYIKCLSSSKLTVSLRGNTTHALLNI